MKSSRSKPNSTLFQLLAFMSAFQHAYSLSQEYCSSQNTGSDYSVVSNIYQSNGACQTECAANYAFAVVQYKDCWCSNYAPSDQEDVSECSTPCPGYPDESCGNSDDGLYGYIALNKSPSGTAGASSAASSTQASSASSTQQQTSSPISSSPAPVSSSSETGQDTLHSSVPVTVYSTVQQSPSVIVSYVTLSSSSESTSSSSSTTSSTSSSTIKSISVTSEVAAATPTSGAFTHTTLVSTQVLTVSGAPVTQTVTTTPMVTNASAGEQQTFERKGVSGGAIAGAVVGSILGVALLLIGAFFLWRRRRQSDAVETLSTTSSSARRKMERNTSVLSKTGLLSSGGPTPDLEKSFDGLGFINTSTNKRSSAMYAAGAAGGHSPVSPIGAGAFDDSSPHSRRNSRPLVYDQRLNPSAIMQNWEANGSRASIGTMQDQRDYSRPLGVTNPDPVDD